MEKQETTRNSRAKQNYNKSGIKAARKEQRHRDAVARAEANFQRAVKAAKQEYKNLPSKDKTMTEKEYVNLDPLVLRTARVAEEAKGKNYVEA